MPLNRYNIHLIFSNAKISRWSQIFFGWILFISTNLRFELNINLITMGFAQNLYSWKSIVLRKRHRLYHFNGLRVLSDFIIAICVNLLLIWFKWSAHLKQNKINFIIFWKDVFPKRESEKQFARLIVRAESKKALLFCCTVFLFYFSNHFSRGKFRLNYCFEYK